LNTVKRRHHFVDFQTLCQILGVDGEPIRMWSDLDGDILHIMTNDSTAPERACGEFVSPQPIQTTNVGICDSCSHEAPLWQVSFHVCKDCSDASTTSRGDPAIIPSPSCRSN
jgi:hypothetical protein